MSLELELEELADKERDFEEDEEDEAEENEETEGSETGQAGEADKVQNDDRGVISASEREGSSYDCCLSWVRILSLTARTYRVGRPSLTGRVRSTDRLHR